MTKKHDQWELIDSLRYTAVLSCLYGKTRTGKHIYKRVRKLYRPIIDVGYILNSLRELWSGGYIDLVRNKSSLWDSRFRIRESGKNYLDELGDQKPVKTHSFDQVIRTYVI